ncbi:hypothetical protein FIBSPDRAFT_922313 [Athelia psychrophila]|uniref:RAVE complex protein Rav1 C-terminal domain-containing protein n=1 Tax=Athelia psychrophila TaxID=1759441 RepID=A0A165ZGA9_9AGAM|nr:hypothetical protein FIBSPDRAFT_922313 [Fibularhizoctonia sp. CBS 109695]
MPLLLNPPKSRFHSIQNRILYHSADAIIILEPASLSLIKILCITDVFPGTSEPIQCTAVDHGMKLVVASTGSRIAAWSLSKGDVWRVHSSLILPKDHTVTTIDCNAGLLAVGSRRGLAVYTLILENDLPTWSQKWINTATTPAIASFCPSMMYICTTSTMDNAVRIFTSTTGRLTQSIPHPRPVSALTWRHSDAASRDDLVPLYTVTSDAVLRIFMPVLDSLQYLQLHGAIDVPFNRPSRKGKGKADQADSSVFWLDRTVVRDAFRGYLATPLGKDEGEDGERWRSRAKEVVEEGWDLFMRIMQDGSVIITAVANIDGRPPRFLKQFILQQLPPNTFPLGASRAPPTHLYILPGSPSSLTLITTAPLQAHTFSPLQLFFDSPSPANSNPWLHSFSNGEALEHVDEEDARIVGFVRTPEGRGVGVLREDPVGDRKGQGEAWIVDDEGDGPVTRLRRGHRWLGGDLVAILDGGNSIATYSCADHTLNLLSSPAPTSGTLVVPDLKSLFALPSPSASSRESIIGITSSLAIVHMMYSRGELTQHSHRALPLATQTSMVLPVDPMAWSSEMGIRAPHDVLLSVSGCGELAFWAFEEAFAQSGKTEGESEWKCTGSVRTGRTGITRARCSSVKKTALVVPGPDGEELSIWDSTISEFASGLEYCTVFSASEPITDLDWTCTPEKQSILAVGFPHRVSILCQQRMTYFDEGPGWTMCYEIDMSDKVPYPISDSVWLANGSLLVGAGHLMFLYGQLTHENANLKGKTRAGTLFDYAARQNGPLLEYHPQILLQCLLWEKVEIVKMIIVNLARALRLAHAGEAWATVWQPLPLEQFLRKDGVASSGQSKQRFSGLFNRADDTDASDEDVFSRVVVMRLIEQLDSRPLPTLTPNEQAHLLVLIQTTLEIDEQRRALDSNGLRYVISMRSFYIFNQKVKSDPNIPQSAGETARQSGYRHRLRYRDMVWAFHSESQDILLNTATSACNGKMCWSDARALGIFVWLRTSDALKAQMEVIARNEYMAGDNRDPTACALFYFALGKVKLVHGLWRQAAWHKEQAVMLKFLNNDFSQPRWRTAALKNAYALLSKRRFQYAAAFFLLGDSLKDAVNVCIKQLSDFQLAITLARIVEQGEDGPVFKDILNNTVLPLAFKDGNRWLGSWAFWTLNRRDLAVRILLTPLRGLADALDIEVKEIGEPHYDDTSLALLFSQLKSKTLQAAKGTSEISGRAEFNFVLQMSRVFCRMGCHVLALDLVRSWSFERPSTIARDPSSRAHHEKSMQTRRPMFPLEPALRRRSSIMIDIEVASEPPTRRASPERVAPIPEESINEEGDLLARKAGMGNLMKSAKQDVKVPEFDMGAFGF